MHTRAFTLVEALACIAASGVLGSIAIVNHQPEKGEMAQRKDSTQVRGIHQAFVVWAQNNQDMYPLPSAIDKKDATVGDVGRAKDTTANIYSLLVYNGMIAPEMLVSPVENNANVEAHKTYEFDKPKAARSPEKALWDPTLKVGLTEGSKGNVSYAHQQPAGGRLEGKRSSWTNSFSADQAVLSNRGPEISEATLRDGGIYTTKLAKPDSNTLKFFGQKNKWAGNVGFNDNHVDFVSEGPGHEQMTRPSIKVRVAEGKDIPDLLFYEEPQDTEHVNSYLSLWTKAGEKPSEYRGIWD